MPRLRIAVLVLSALAACDARRAVAVLPRPDYPAPADAWRSLTLRGADGTIPHGALLRAKAEVAGPFPTGTAGGLDSTAWSEIGPSQIAGRVRSIAQHPSSLNLYVGSVSGGIWIVPEAGGTAQKVDDLMTNLAITSLLTPLNDPSTLYAATGEGFGNTDAVRGAGIFKSTNGGTTWAQLPSTNTPDFYWVNRLALSSDFQTILAATGTGLFRTTNAGTTWIKVYGSANTSCLDVRWHPTNTQLAVASVRDYDTAGATWYSATLYSTNAGVTWTPSPSLRTNSYTDRVELAFMRSYNNGAAPGCLYALKATGTGTSLYRSFTGGVTFQLVANPPGVLSAGWYANALWVDPTDSDSDSSNDKIVIGGLDLWRSTNGGAAFTRISDWTKWPNSPHADQHVVQEARYFDGSNNLVVYVGSDGGLWRADNILTCTPTTGWTNMNAGLAITQFYGASRSRNTDVVFGGTQDNGTLRFSGNPAAWTQSFGGDGGACASDPTDSLYHYGEYVYLQLLRSKDAGATASYIHSGISDAGDKSPAAQTANFVAPFALDPNNPNTLVAGGTSLWRSTNVKATVPTWTAIKAPGGSLISAVAIAAGNSNIIWVGHNNGDVYSTTNGTAANPTWTRRDNTSPALPDRYVTRIKIDPADNNRVFVALGGFAFDNLWQSTNAGSTWTAATGLPVAPVRDIEINEARPTWLYAATEVGLLISENNGASFTAAATPARVSIDQLFWSGHSLYLVTHGRGMFRQLAYSLSSQQPIGSACQFGGPVTGPSLACATPTLGTTVALNLANGTYPGTATLLLTGVPAAPYQLSPGCFMQIDLVNVVNLGSIAVLPAGTAAWSLQLPDQPVFAGIKLMTQAAAVSSGTLRLTNGVKLTLGY